MSTNIDERLYALQQKITEAKQQGLDPAPLIQEHRTITQGRRERREQQRRPQEAAGPELRIVSSLDEFRSLEPQWDALLLNSDAISPFLTQAWLVPWLESFGSDYTLHMAVVQQGELLLGALPLMVGRERHGFYRGPVARFAGTGPGLRGDYFSFPMLPKLDAQVGQMLHDHVNALVSDGHILLLEHLSPFRDGQRTMELLFREQRRNFTIDTELPCIHGVLPDSYIEFIESVPAPNRRRRLRHDDIIDCQDCADVVYATCESLGELDGFLSSMARLNVRRRRAQGEMSTWADPQNMRCRRAAAEALLNRGMLRLDRLLWNGDAIGVLMGMVYKNIYFCYNMGFDDAYSRHEPGHVLVARRLRGCIEEGLSRFNFLVGDADYKRQYFRDSSPELTLTCLPRGGSARLLDALRRLASAVRK